MASLLILLVASSLLISIAVTWAMHHLSPLLKLIDHPGGRKAHAHPTPSGGGVGIFFAIWLPVGAGLAACYWAQNNVINLPLWFDLGNYAKGALALTPRLGIIFLGALIIWGVGLADDRKGLPPWLRLCAQTGVAIMVMAGGIKISIFLDSAILRTIITILWIVGLINAFNLLDNMDGLSTGVALIISSVFCFVALQTGQFFIAALLCCIIGALAGFLVYNFPPAVIFMGDSGGTLVGYLLAVLTIEFTFYQPERPYFPVIVPLILFSLPLFDTITVVWIRLRERRSPFLGDTNHFSHRLVALGMTNRQAVLTIYLITATVALGTTVLYYANSAAIIVIFVQTVALFTIIGIFERARPKNKTPQRPT